MEEIITYFRFQEIHICLIICIHCWNVAPVIFYFITVDFLQILISDKNIGHKIMSVIFCAMFDQIDQLASSDYIDTCRYNLRLCHHRLFLELFNTHRIIHLDRSETACIFVRTKFFAYHCNIRFLCNVIFQYFVIIHLIYSITGCNDYIRFVTSL